MGMKSSDISWDRYFLSDEGLVIRILRYYLQKKTLHNSRYLLLLLLDKLNYFTAMIFDLFLSIFEVQLALFQSASHVDELPT